METETISYEEKEQQLVNDCVKELSEYTCLQYPYHLHKELFRIREGSKSCTYHIKAKLLSYFNLFFLPDYSYNTVSCCYSTLIPP